MVKIKAFRGWRPQAEKILRVASPPYDVLNSDEARAMAAGNADSFLHIIKPEIDLPEGTDLYSDAVYEKAGSNWSDFKNRGLFLQDASPCLYFYRQIAGDHSQTGIVAASSIDDYFEDRIKKHEFTRPKKENDRIAHMYHLGIHPGPVFLTYKNDRELDDLVADYTGRHDAANDFTAADGVRHTLWVVDDAELIGKITSAFADRIDATYIADGHHRAAASSKVGQRLRDEGNTDQGAAHNFFLSVLFPDDQLSIIDYNRLLKDLNGMEKSEFLGKVEEAFEMDGPYEGQVKPSAPKEFGMYIDGQWYRLTARSHAYDETDVIKCLDVTILSDHLIGPVLGITDQRRDDRIDFVGGIRGLEELERRVDSGEMRLAFALYPVSIRQLINIADAGQVMPPKSTWFEPKLRSGMVVHEFRGQAACR
jgi:uncharacterized protein (DUF1015 family)